MTSMFIFFGCTILLLAPAFLALPDGAPPDVCTNGLVPQHSGSKKGSASGPYSLTASAASFKGGKPITVTLSGPASKPFKGYVIQAQYSDGTPLEGGQWEESEQIQELPCAAITHRSRDAKDKVTASFTPPEGEGDVVFVATVVENYRSYYANIRSKSSSRSPTTSVPSFDRIGHQPAYEPYNPYSAFYDTQTTQDQANYDPYSQYVSPNFQQTAYQPSPYAPSRGDFSPAPASYNPYETQADLAPSFAPAPSPYDEFRNAFPSGFNSPASFVPQAQQPQSYMIPNNGQQRYSPYNNQQRQDMPSMYQPQQYVPQQQMQQYPRYQQPYMQPAYNYGQRRYNGAY